MKKTQNSVNVISYINVITLTELHYIMLTEFNDLNWLMFGNRITLL